MEAHGSDRIVLRPTDELVALPPHATVWELIEHGSDRGRCEFLPESHRLASAWYPEAVGSKGGAYVPAWWSDDPYIPSSTVHLFCLRDAYYIPEFGVVFSQAGEVMEMSMREASYLTPDLTLLPHTERVGDETVIDLPRDVDTVEDIVVTMPWGGVNYGHFLLDCMPAVALVAEISELGRYRFAFPPLSSWARRHLELVGVDDPVELDQPIYRVSNVIWTSCMRFFLHRPNISYRTLRGRQLARKQTTSVALEQVYISRRGVLGPDGTPKRLFLAEQELEERLERLGFAIIAPEQYTIDEQIDIFRNAHVIVGCSGAAFANVLYCRRGATIVEIAPASMADDPITWVRSICAIVGCKWRPYFCTDNRHEALAGGGEPRELGYSFDLDIDDLLGYIEGLT